MPAFDTYEEAKEYIEETISEARKSIALALTLDDADPDELTDLVDEWCALLQEEARPGL